MSRKIEDLKPKARDALIKAINQMQASGVRFSIQSTLRTVPEQQALFAQGREPLDVVNAKRLAANMPPISLAENQYTVTNCDGINKLSKHQSGLAVDIVPLDARGRPYWPIHGAMAWTPIARIMIQNGFDWGGAWKDFPDDPHYSIEE